MEEVSISKDTGARGEAPMTCGRMNVGNLKQPTSIPSFFFSELREES